MSMRGFLLCGWLGASLCSGGEVLFQDNFQGALGEGWSWIREHRSGWRVTSQGLEIRMEPGNMWGSANNAKNVLVRPAPNVPDAGLSVSVQVENRPAAQYEQIDLVWYYDDSHMVKLGQELVNGKLSVVMGREEKDRTRTIAILPLKAFSLELRLRVQGGEIWGEFRPVGTEEWTEAGHCDLPAPTGGRAQISLQAYQGPADQERWARVTRFRIAER